MIITKYNQSCLLIETNKKRILIDPGKIGYDRSLLDEWKDIDYILITHRHSDHCNTEAINEIIRRDNAILYTTEEVKSKTEVLNPTIVKQGDIIDLGDIKIEVTKAIHGFRTIMKSNGGEILENVGYIIDDGHKKIYITSDTINFNHNYKGDILCMPFNGNGITLGIIDGIEFAKDINPELIIPVHMEMKPPILNPNLDLLKESLEKENLNYKILNVKEKVEI